MSILKWSRGQKGLKRIHLHTCTKKEKKNLSEIVILFVDILVYLRSASYDGISHMHQHIISCSRKISDMNFSHTHAVNETISAIPRTRPLVTQNCLKLSFRALKIGAKTRLFRNIEFRIFYSKRCIRIKKKINYRFTCTVKIVPKRYVPLLKLSNTDTLR